MNSTSTNGNQSVNNLGLCIHQAIEKQAVLRPEAVAVSCGQERLTYRQLNEKANQLAHYLRHFGVCAGSPVALCLERSLDMVVAILGVLKAGGAYVPVDLAYPKARLSFMLEDTKAPVLLTQQSLAESLPEHSAKVICLDSEWSKIKAQSVENPPSLSAGEDVAYIIFTSGSTGKPKGVMVTHQNVMRLFTSTEPWFHFGSEDVWTLFHSYAFDFSVWEIWGALFYGGRLVVVPYLVSRSPEGFYELLGREGVTVLNQTPSAFRQLMWAEASASKRQDLKLRYVIFGGEALELQSLKPWFDLHGDQTPLLVNMYGITETTVHVTYREIRKEDLAHGLGSVIGVPIPDLQLYLLGEDLKPVATGSEGEIFVGGAGVAKGYLNRPELNQQRFIADPFTRIPGARLYRSGDLARFLDNGELEYLGRADQQIKIRGFRIELGEIEAALNSHPAIQESAVVASEVPGADKRLLAYLVARDGGLSTTELREYLGQRIPEYMIPATFVFLPALPLTPNGKLDRRALPAPDRARPATETAYVAPHPETEEILASIWSEVLEVAPIGIDDNFFEMGGDSIRCIQVLARAHKKGLPFSLEQLFQEQTIRKMAALLENASAMSTECSRTEPFALVSPADRQRLPAGLEDAYPMLMLQSGMFFHNDLNPASANYHDVFTFRIQFPFIQSKLEMALAQFVARHASMRTSFDLVNFSEPLQLVHPSATVPLTVEDLRHLSSAAQEQALDGWINTEKYKAFDRAQAPLLRVAAQLYSDEVFQLMVSFHHAILDGWSLAAFLTELLQDYSALIKGAGEVIAAPKIAYREYVALERQAIESASCREFWSKKMQDSPSPRFPRWPKAFCSGGTEQKRGPEIQISSEVFEGLKKLAQKAGTPFKSVLQAAHFRALNLLHGNTDVITGLVTNGRPEEVDGEKIIGLSLNTVPMRVGLHGGTWLELVRQVFEAERELMPFRRFPLIEIQKLAGGQCLFETAFDFVHFHVYKNLQGYQDMGFLEGHYAEGNTFALLTTFMLDVTSTQLQVHCDYDPEELCLQQVAALCGYYVKILEQMAADPSARYEEFSPLLAEERQQLLVEWNHTATPMPAETCITEIFEAQVARTPKAIAIVDAERRLTYGELNARANQLARRLRSLGVGPDVLVAVCMERSIELVIAILGCLKAGGAYVPLDPDYPCERLVYMLQDSHAPILLTQKNLGGKLFAQGQRRICLDSDWNLIATESRENVAAKAPPESLIYVIYTSGSTGRPKGTAVYRRGFNNLMQWFNRDFSINAKDRVLMVSSQGFDLTQKNFFAPLMRGGLLHLLPCGPYDPERIVEEIEKSKITLINCTPSVFYPLLEPVEDRTYQRLQSLRCVFLGGEPISKARLRPWFDSPYCHAEVANTYGPTECADISASYRVNKDNLDQLECIPIGRPIDNVQLAIVDSHMGPCPIRVPGELCIGGIGVGAGYLNNPTLTASRFIKNPFSEIPSQTLYKTGDLARYSPDGNIEYLGRIDDQVKIRGFRIELGEIEAVLRQHPNVREAAVLAQEIDSSEKRLVAYFTPKTQSNPQSSELREFLKTTLPDHMAPSAFVLLASMPLSPNGKIDRKALAKMECDRSVVSETSFSPPKTEIEIALAEIWQSVLRAPRIGIHDNFFDLGGHSLLATQVVSRIRTVLHQELSLRAFFQSPTVAELSALLVGKKQTVHAPIQRVNRSEALPLSFAQQRLWFLDQLEPGSLAYMLQHGLRLTGPLEPPALERCLNEIVRRHESLRTVFPQAEGRPAQKILQAATLRLGQIDLRHLSEAEREVEATKLAVEESRQSIDLQQGPICRARLLRMGNTDHILLLTMHHISFDGWSFGVLLDELTALYPAFLAGKSSPLPELPIQYADFAAWQREWLGSGVMEDQLKYWKKQLENAPPLSSLPTDFPRPQSQSYHGARVPAFIKASVAEPFKKLCQEEGCTLFMGLLAAFEALVYRYTGQSDVLVGSPIANRNRAEIEGLIGCFINTLVLRSDLSGEPSFREALKRVREVTLEAYAHQDVPFEKIIEEIQPARDQSYSPLFQLMFVLQNAPATQSAAEGLAFKAFDVDNGSAKYDLTLALNETPEGLEGRVEYCSDLFEEATIQRLLGHFERLLAGMAEKPGEPINRLALLSEGERQQMVVEWNQGLSDYPSSPSVHELIEARVAAAPDAIAVVEAGRELTYWHLNNQANEIALRLRRNGVGPESLVGVCVERSLDMVAGALGILKAGGAFVPLDPDCPEERLRFMIEDTGMTLLLTQKKIQAALPSVKAQILCIDERAADFHCQNPANKTKPSDAAYVIYTSGSTGKPKGVVVEHGAMTQHCLECVKRYELTPQDRVLQFASLNFDVSVEQIFATLMSGARVMLREPEIWTPEQFGQKIEEWGLTVIGPPPAYWHQLATSWASSPTPVLPHQVRLVQVGGEEMQSRSLDVWQQTAFNKIRLLNCYGPTETSVTATDFEVPPRVPGSKPLDKIPIGRARGNRDLYVLDPWGQPAPIGVLGELHIGGATLARGYLNRPELTAEKFIPNPFKPGSRLYKTGDLVRYLADGNLEYWGRIDQQVKIRGFRIELGEIESVLRQHPKILQAAVIVIEGREKQLAAYFVSKESPAPPIDDLREFLANKLPDYMIPSFFTELEKLPLTSGGKINRKALPKPEIQFRTSEAEAPRTPEEEVLSRVWCEVLGLARVGLNDNFFGLGGHSLLATQVVSRTHSLGYLNITLKDLFESPTIVKLGKRMQETKVKQLGRSTIPSLTALTRKPKGSIAR